MDKDRGSNHKPNAKKEEERTDQKPDIHIVQDGNAVKRGLESEDIPVLYHAPKKTKEKRFLPIFLTISSASIIGIVLGVIMLQMFVTMDDPPTVVNTTSSNDIPATNDDIIGSQIPEVSGYMLQAGVFTEQGNAEEWKNTFESESIPAIIWEQEGQYYLFVGIYGTEEEAKQQAASLKEDGFDIFAKPWSTNQVEVELKDTEAEWLASLQETWMATLADKNGEPLVELLSVAPNNESFRELLPQFEGATNDDYEQLYLDLMYFFERLENYI